MHEEVHRQSHGMVGEQEVDVEQEPVEDVFEDGPDDVAQEECRDCVCERNRGNATSDKCFEGCSRINGEGRKRVRAKGELDQGTDKYVRRNGQPDGRDDIPRRTREDLRCS